MKKQSSSNVHTHTRLNPPTQSLQKCPQEEEISSNVLWLRTPGASGNRKFTINRECRKPFRNGGKRRVRWARTAVSAKQENTGKKIGPVELLFSRHPAPRMALVRRLFGFWLPWCFFFLDNSLP